MDEQTRKAFCEQIPADDIASERVAHKPKARKKNKKVKSAVEAEVWRDHLEHRFHESLLKH